MALVSAFPCPLVQCWAQRTGRTSPRPLQGLLRQQRPPALALHGGAHPTCWDPGLHYLGRPRCSNRAREKAAAGGHRGYAKGGEKSSFTSAHHNPSHSLPCWDQASFYTERTEDSGNNRAGNGGRVWGLNRCLYPGPGGELLLTQGRGDGAPR